MVRLLAVMLSEVRVPRFPVLLLTLVAFWSQNDRVDATDTHVDADAAAQGKTGLGSCTCEPVSKGRRVLDDLRALRKFGAADSHPLGVVRQALTSVDLEARRWLSQKMESEAGLVAHMDGIGTTIAVRKGTTGGSGGLPLVLLGSHSDTQPEGGWLDGALGVIYALEAARAFAEADCAGRWAVVNWSDEEGRFGTVAGSASFVGQDRVVKKEELLEARKAAGLDTTPLLRYDNSSLGPLHAYFEAHIEQGKRLEDARQQIAVVTSIVGLWQYSVTFEGQQNHAGTTPMAVRRDAGLAAMRFAVALDEQFKELCQGRETVWTFGRLDLQPGSHSIVPGKAVLTVQFRDTSVGLLGLMEQSLHELASRFREDAATNSVAIQIGPRGGIEPANMAPELQTLSESAADKVAPGNWSRMHSGAVHDASNLARVVRSAMIFVPSIGGISHNFNENTADEDIEAGAAVYVQAAFAMVLSSLGDACHAERRKLDL